MIDRLTEADRLMLEKLVDVTLEAYRGERIDQVEARKILMRTLAFMASGNEHVMEFAESVIADILQ